MKVTKLEQIKVARDAFDAWERAVVAAHEALGDGPTNGVTHGLGTCIMVGRPRRTYQESSYKCSECRGEGKRDWKFCAFCGAEIMRFDEEVLQDGEYETIEVQVTQVPQKMQTVLIHVEEPALTHKSKRKQTSRTQER